MKNKNKVLIGALLLILIGVIMMGIASLFGGHAGFYVDGTGFHAMNSEKTPYILEKTEIDEFVNADIAVDFADITVIPSDGYYLEYKLHGNSPKPEYSVQNQKLIFNEGSQRKGLNFGTQFTFFSFGNINSDSKSYYVNLYVPKDSYYTLFNIQNDSGKVSIDSINAETLNLTVDFGALELGTFKGKNLKITADSGNMKFINIDTDKMILKNSFGEVEGGKLTCDTADIELDSGNFTIDSATIADLKMNNDFGNVTFDSIICTKGEIELESGGLELNYADVTELTLKNSFGSIDVNLSFPLSDYDYDLNTDFGKIIMEGYHGSDYETHNNKGKSIKANCDSGDIKITGK